MSCWIYLVVYVYDGCERWFRILVILWPFWRGFVVYGVGWYGSDNVDVGRGGE